MTMANIKNFSIIQISGVASTRQSTYARVQKKREKVVCSQQNVMKSRKIGKKMKLSGVNNQILCYAPFC